MSEPTNQSPCHPPPKVSRPAPHASSLASRSSRLTSHASRHAPRASSLASHSSSPNPSVLRSSRKSKMIKSTFQMLNFKDGAVLQNGDDIKAYLDIIEIMGSHIMICTPDQKLYLLLGNGRGYGNDMVCTARPHLDDGENIPFLGYNVDFGLQMAVVFTFDGISFFYQKVCSYFLTFFAEFVVLSHKFP